MPVSIEEEASMENLMSCSVHLGQAEYQGQEVKVIPMIINIRVGGLSAAEGQFCLVVTSAIFIAFCLAVNYVIVK